MKSIFRSIAVLAAVAFSLAACGGAQAQVMPEMFKASNGAVLTTHDVRSVEQVPGFIRVIYQNGNDSYQDFSDSSGSVFANVLASPGFTDKFVRVGTSNRYVQASQGRRTFCNYNGTMIVWMVGSAEEFAGDGCALHQAIAARAK